MKRLSAYPARRLLATAVCSLAATVVHAVPMVRVKLAGPLNASDETVVYYQQGATDGFDAMYDAYKLGAGIPAPCLAQEHGTVLLAINGIQPVTQSFTVMLRFTAPSAGNYTLSAADFTALPAGTSVGIYDTQQGIAVNILAGSYSFYHPGGSAQSKFVLSIGAPVASGGGGKKKTASPGAVVFDNEQGKTKNEPVKVSARSLTDMGGHKFMYAADGLRSLPVVTCRSFTSPFAARVEAVEFAEGQGCTIDLSGLPAGLYLLRVEEESGFVFAGKILLRERN